MIKLFITDIDGCLLEPFETPDWHLLGKIRSYNEKSRSEETIPPLTICTGRPMPYAEAVAQWMGIKQPIVFESAGIFYPDRYEIAVNGKFNEEAKQQVDALKAWLRKEIVSRFEGMTPEFSKLMDAGLVHPEKEVIQQALPGIREHIAANYDRFEVHWTDVSINIILKGNNKKAGIEKLCELYNVDPAHVAYIGDSSGDIPGLEMVGHPLAPQNASEAVKKVARVMSQPTTKAVLEAYQRLIDINTNRS